ncbi:hypothetical protein [Streptomyces enissocaesilis]
MEDPFVVEIEPEVRLWLTSTWAATVTPYGSRTGSHQGGGWFF